jgi:hypothetical protein
MSKLRILFRWLFDQFIYPLIASPSSRAAKRAQDQIDQEGR